jgi:hypothetical protein
MGLSLRTLALLFPITVLLPAALDAVANSGGHTAVAASP